MAGKMVKAFFLNSAKKEKKEKERKLFSPFFQLPFCVTLLPNWVCSFICDSNRKQISFLKKPNTDFEEKDKQFG